MNEQMIYLYREFVAIRDAGGVARDTEDSRTVVRYWYNQQAKYALENIDDIQCLRIVAERLLVRRLLGFEGLDADYEEQVANVNVFGDGTPRYSELMAPEVFVAMAFVPLTPTDDIGRPRLARLYCVGGLATLHCLPLDGMDNPALQGYSWFLEGVPLDERNRGIAGRSWLLAAHLLARIVACRDVRKARKLATQYIVTGDVSDGKVRVVEMGRKEELLRDFTQFNWMIPMENDMEINTMKIRKPANLDEALQMLEGIGGAVTKSLAKIIQSPDVSVDSCLGSLKGFADPHAMMGNGMNVLQHFEISWDSRMFRLFEDAEELMRGAKVDDGKIAIWRERMSKAINAHHDVGSALSYFASAPQMYFTAARFEDVKLLKQLVDSGFDVNATDPKGMTALDFAIYVAHDDVAARVLQSVGANRRGLYEIGSDKLQDAFRDLFYRCAEPAAKNLFVLALQNGLDPNETFRMEDEFCYWYHASRLDNIGTGKEIPLGEDEPPDFDGRHLIDTKTVFDQVRYALQLRIYSMTPYLVALASGDGELISLCEEKGADPNVQVLVSGRQRVQEELFEASGKERVVHDVVWAEDDFAPYSREKCSIKALVKGWNKFDGAARDSVNRKCT